MTVENVLERNRPRMVSPLSFDLTEGAIVAPGAPWVNDRRHVASGQLGRGWRSLWCQQSADETGQEGHARGGDVALIGKRLRVRLRVRTCLRLLELVAACRNQEPPRLQLFSARCASLQLVRTDFLSQGRRFDPCLAISGRPCFAGPFSFSVARSGAEPPGWQRRWQRTCPDR